IIISLLAVAACKKDKAVDGGSWSFKGTTYNVTSGIASGVYTATEIDDSFVTQDMNGHDSMVYETYDNVFKTLTLVSSGTNTYSHLIFTFWDLPTASGQYTFTTNQLPDSASTQIGVDMRITTGATYDGNSYVPNSNTVTANVSVNNGLITVSFQDLDMVNVNDPTDHSTISGTVKQTQK
ncbi:MAG: hypothetical protein JST76_07145, partial [Bacteroidetes bacterium]|nr:hypothetical protein [Bacteroidota bacterium]